MNLGFPDVCLTPTPVGPIPIPYPNIGMSATHVPNVLNQFAVVMPCHNMLTQGTISNGDNAGVNMGVASGLVMGPDRNIMGSVKVFRQCMPATKMLSPTIQNSTNCPGVSLTPSQIKLLILA